MRHFAEYIIKPVEGYRSERTDGSLEEIYRQEICGNGYLPFRKESCGYSDGAIKVYGDIWEEEIYNFIAECSVNHEACDIPLVIYGHDEDEPDLESSLFLAYIKNGKIFRGRVTVNISYQSFDPAVMK